MISGGTNLHCIDTKNEALYLTDIDHIFQKYSHLAKELSDGSYKIIFDPEIHNLKISDLYGWTNVLSILKMKVKHQVSIDLGLTKGIFTADTLIPIYNPWDFAIGFHGERRHPFKLVPIVDLKEGDTIKVRLSDDNGDNIEFMQINNNTLQVNEIELEAYKISTQSRFYNASNIYVYDDEIIPSNYCTICPLYNKKECAKCRYY